MGNSELAISSKSKNKDAAWEVIKYLLPKVDRRGLILTKTHSVKATITVSRLSRLVLNRRQRRLWNRSTILTKTANSRC
jgi:maltose-binding protein MalE